MTIATPPFRCYFGYDSREDIAFQVRYSPDSKYPLTRQQVARFSITKHSSVPLEVVPLKRQELQEQGIYTREQDPKQSTEFTYLRFLLPHLNNYEGWALFADDDFLWLGDVAELISQIDDRYAVMCVKHDYTPSVNVKLANVSQEAYPRKNWSSMMLVNCGHPANRHLTLEEANSRPGSYLHRFSWLQNDSLIGEIDYEWNFLVKHYRPYENERLPKAIHYTEGGPWFPDHRNTDYGCVWLRYMREYESTLSKTRHLCPYERFSIHDSPILGGYANSDDRWVPEDD